MALDVVRNGNGALVVCRGHLVRGATADSFHACVRRLLRRHGRVGLDLSGVMSIDARGVGTLATLLTRAIAANRRLVLEQSSARVQRVLHISGLDVPFQNDIAVQRRHEAVMSGVISTPGEDRAVDRGRPAKVAC